MIGPVHVLWLAFVALLPQSSASDYGLKPQQVAENTYVFVGLNQDFSLQNGGNIVNTSFIITDDGVIVIDTGPSLRYGKQMREAISTVTDKPIVQVYNTHLHPDHFLGNLAFKDVPIGALKETIAGIQEHGDRFTDNLYRLVDRWMQGTQVLAPTKIVSPGDWEFGGHKFKFIRRAGHTDADLVILNETTGVLFAGDTVFNGRAPTTPHADLDDWIETLDFLRELQFDVLVPGHGTVANGLDSIEQTKGYLQWLQGTFRAAANQGTDMAELLFHDLPQSFKELAVVRSEFQRSVSHLFPKYEAQAVPLATTP